MSWCQIAPQVYTTFGTYPSRSEGSGRSNGSRKRAMTFRRIGLVQQYGPNRVLSDRADAVGQQQPALVEFDRRAAIADLHELP